MHPGVLRIRLGKTDKGYYLMKGQPVGAGKIPQADQATENGFVRTAGRKRRKRAGRRLRRTPHRCHHPGMADAARYVTDEPGR